MRKAEVKLGARCICGCGNDYDGMVITHVGQETAENLINRIRKAGEEVARELIYEINYPLEDSKKDEIVKDFVDTIDQDSISNMDWSNVIGYQLERTVCPKCKTGNIPTEYYKHFTCDDCGEKNFIAAQAKPIFLTCVCGSEYEADYHLVKD